MKFLVIDTSLNDAHVEFETEEEVKEYIEEHSESEDQAGSWRDRWQDKIKVYQICREVKLNVDFKVVVTME